MKFSVLMSVYRKEKREYFVEAMESVLNQTVLPDEIVLVRDGIVPEELQSVIDEYREKYKCICYIPLEENKGLWNALNIGVNEAKNELIARMDTDDICVPNRFELQLNYFQEHPEVDVCGGQIVEFIDEIENLSGKRVVPCTHEEILQYLKARCPFNHVTVMYKKSAVLAAGNYLELPLVEDYYLWCRMAQNGSVFANLPETLTYVRIGEEMFQRRGGLRYYKCCKALEKYKLKNKMITRTRYIKNVLARFIVQVLMPNRLRSWTLKKFARKTHDE